VDVTERSLWRHGDFMKLWTGQTVSELGSVVTRTALPFAAVITLHATALQVGILVASASIAVLLVGLFAGALVDRSRRRPLMIAADAIRAATLVTAAAIVFAGAPVWIVYVLSGLVAVTGTAFRPAQAALVPSLARTPQELTAANVVASTIESAGIFIGPALGAFLLAVSSTGVVFLVTAATFVWSAALVLRITPKPAPKTGELAGRQAVPRARCGRLPRDRGRPGPARAGRPLRRADLRHGRLERAGRRRLDRSCGTRQLRASASSIRRSASEGFWARSRRQCSSGANGSRSDLASAWCSGGFRSR